MSIPLQFLRDSAGLNTFLFEPSQNTFSITLQQNVEVTFTIPSNEEKWACIFLTNPGVSFWVNINKTVTIPGSSFTTDGSLPNPPGFYLNKGDVVHVITADVTASFAAELYFERK